MGVFDPVARITIELDNLQLGPAVSWHVSRRAGDTDHKQKISTTVLKTFRPKECLCFLCRLKGTAYVTPEIFIRRFHTNSN